MKNTTLEERRERRRKETEMLRAENYPVEAVGRTIIEQMGGLPRLEFFIGADILEYYHSGIRFAVSEDLLGVFTEFKEVDITLNGSDLYDLEFVHMEDEKENKIYNNIFAEDLINIFEEKSGLLLSF